MTAQTAVPDCRESIADAPNPLGLEGIEFVEYATSRPQQLGLVLERMGFVPLARHRSREVLLYRLGALNVIVNAHARATTLPEQPQLVALALRVRDAASAYARAIERGAWGIAPQVEVMELHIPAIHGVGNSRIYLVDRWREFSIYDVDFVPLAQPTRAPAAAPALHFFGLVQYIGNERTQDWTEFYRELFGFAELPDTQRFGILPKGRILCSPCPPASRFYIQLIEPEPGLLEVEGDEGLQRMGLGCADVLASVASLQQRGVEFVESAHVRTDVRGALTRTQLGSVSFEIVHDVR